MSKEGLCVKPEKNTIIPMVSEVNKLGIVPAILQLFRY